MSIIMRLSSHATKKLLGTLVVVTYWSALFSCTPCAESVGQTSCTGSVAADYCTRCSPICAAARWWWRRRTGRRRTRRSMRQTSSASTSGRWLCVRRINKKKVIIIFFKYTFICITFQKIPSLVKNITQMCFLDTQFI